ncbi:uncharacterized protein I206_101555 [Kwoniella pini CBS 10737]|uniref:Uncharacterized protein n=1 Tax=Kwoniella pini CBS 10737 TaxID=1296096 RepID=A0A1B9HWD1_9TREE|nr:uncharacterized protein I206_06473 [Kwoniella pini CBS 10737]OCF47570.1 hypothetical protein I206_06473 [Kwoniella pini CBS 10737]
MQSTIVLYLRNDINTSTDIQCRPQSGVQPKFLISQSSALWGRMVPYPNETCGGDQQGYKYVGFESYLFPVHATAVFARGKYPLLKKRRVILCLSTKQYHGVEMYMAPK